VSEAPAEHAGAAPAASPATPSEEGHPELAGIRSRIEQGGAARYHEAAAAKGKLFARQRIELLAPLRHLDSRSPPSSVS